MMTPEERYRTDAAFASLVNVMHGYIERALFTPSEIREAAILAAIRYEMRRAIPARIVHAEAALDVLSRMDEGGYRGPGDPSTTHGGGAGS